MSLDLQGHGGVPLSPGAAQGIDVCLAGLSKAYRRQAVLRDVTVAFGAGRSTALIGPNAAGKSTLLKCILGLCRADAGTITVGGVVVGGDPTYRSAIGYMPQRAQFPEHLTVREVLRLLDGFRGSASECGARLYERFQLSRDERKALRTLSGGTRQKLNAAIACRFGPRLLILDEPTAGLDPVAAGVLKEHLQAARQSGKTIVVTSHVLAELEELVDDVVLLLDGRSRYAGSLEQLREMTAQHSLERAIAQIMLRQDAA